MDVVAAVTAGGGEDVIVCYLSIIMNYFYFCERSMMRDETDVVSLAREGLMNDPTDIYCIINIIPYNKRRRYGFVHL